MEEVLTELVLEVQRLEVEVVEELKGYAREEVEGALGVQHLGQEVPEQEMLAVEARDQRVSVMMVGV